MDSGCFGSTTTKVPSFPSVFESMMVWSSGHAMRILASGTGDAVAFSTTLSLKRGLGGFEVEIHVPYECTGLQIDTCVAWASRTVESIGSV